MDTTTLVLGLAFGSIGLGYVVFGRRQRRAVALVGGVGLIALPYIVSGVLPTVLLGLAFMALPLLIAA